MNKKVKKLHQKSCGRKNSAGAPETEPPCMHRSELLPGYPAPGRAVLTTPIASMTVSHASVRATQPQSTGRSESLKSAYFGAKRPFQSEAD